MKVIAFFGFSCAILIFSIINLFIGPIINKKVTRNYISIEDYSTPPNIDDLIMTRGNSWGTLNCKLLSDFYDIFDENNPLSAEEKEYDFKWKINECERKKAMYNMEYTSFIFNIIIGFVCGLLGLLHLLEVKKYFIPKTGLISIGCGIVGFIFTFFYIVYNGIVYTNYYDNKIPKRDSDGSYAKRTQTPGKFECLYYDEYNNHYSVYAKYSDLIKKQYNYEKDFYESVSDDNCITDRYYLNCAQSDIIDLSLTSLASCKKIYANSINNVVNRDKSKRFLTCLILSLLICIFHICLVIFGFELYKNFY